MSADSLPVLQDQPVIFSATGDVPYSDSEVPVFQGILDDHNRYSPSKFLVHVGDIFSGGEACDEFKYARMADLLQSLAVPAFIVPGDNETTDCSNPGQAWSYWVAHLLGIEADFCGVPPVERQAARTENFAFTLDGVLFLGINLVGGSNDANVMQDDADWTGAQLQDHAGDVRAAVLFAQAGPGSGRDLFFNQFVTQAAAFGKPVLLLHGDGHAWILDRPFAGVNILRVQIERGDEPPVQVTVTLDAQNPWLFDRDPWPPGTPVVNHPPCVNAGPDQALAAAGTTTLQGSVQDDGLPAGTLATQWSQVSAPAGATFSAPTALTTAVTLPATGTYVFRLTANDGALSGSDDVIVAVGVQVNRPPVARDDSWTTPEDVQLVVAAPGLLQNDSDPDGNALSATVVGTPLHGSLSLSGNGSFTYTPAADYFGSDSFTYRASDGLGGTDTAVVTLTILPVNDAPATQADSFYVRPGENLDVAAPGVLGNDRDVEGDPMLANLVGAPEHGSLALGADGSFAYTPAPGFVGWDAFTYRASDGMDTSAPTTVTLGVGIRRFTPVADAYVRSNWNKNQGSDTSLQVKNGPQVLWSYLKFDVRGLALVRSAVLRLYVSSGSDPVSLYPVSNHYDGTSVAWTETGIVWDNAPPMLGTPLGVASAAGGAWVEWDLSSTLRGDGTVSFGLQTTVRNTVQYSSREGAHPPELVIAELPPGPHQLPPEEVAAAGEAGGGSAASSAPAAPAPDPDQKTSQGTTSALGVTVLRRVVPNPFRSGAYIEYELAEPSAVEISVYNVRGFRVRRLVGSVRGSGRRTIYWDGRDDAGMRLGSGIYFLEARLGSRRFTRKLLMER